MASFVARLRAEILERLKDVPGAHARPAQNRGQSRDEREMPKVWAWVENDDVERFSDPDEGQDSSITNEHRKVSLVVGVTAKSSAAVSAMDSIVTELRRVMRKRFDDRDFFLQSIDYGDVDDEGASEFVSASLNFTISYTAPEDDAE